MNQSSRCQTSPPACGIAWNGRYTCRSPICPACRRRYIREEQRLNVERFGCALPGELARVTIKLAATTDVLEIDTIITKGLRDLRNRIHACRRQSDAWDEVTLAGWWVIDAAELSGRRPYWIVSAKTLWFIGDVTPADLMSALEGQWRQPGRVAVRSLAAGGSPEHAIAQIVAQANAHACLYVAEDGQERAWPSAWIDGLYGWLHQHRRNVWEYLRFNVEPAAALAPAATKYPTVDWVEHGAMPIVM